MANIQLKIADLNKMTAVQILDDPDIKTRFIEKFNQIHNSEDGEVFYESEKYNFQKLLTTSKDLKECTGFSIYGVFMDVAAMGLTITPQTKPLLYVLVRNVNVGNQNNAVWEKRAYIDVSPYGELALRVQAGQILYADRPVVAYEGDVFRPGMNEFGQKYVKYEAAVPRKSKTIIGAFIGITRPDKSKDFFWMLEDDINRLRKASNKQNSRGKNANQDNSNALYSSNEGQIDTGFLEAKVLKHSLMVFPKIKLGQFTNLQNFEDEPKPADYGITKEDAAELNKAKADISAFYPDNEPEQEENSVIINDNSEIF